MFLYNKEETISIWRQRGDNINSFQKPSPIHALLLLRSAYAGVSAWISVRSQLRLGLFVFFVIGGFMLKLVTPQMEKGTRKTF